MSVPIFAGQQIASSHYTDNITSADELASCFGDDICTSCGNSVHAGNLYCSRQCRDEDAKGIVNVPGSTPPHSVSALTSNQSVPFAGHIQSTESAFKHTPPTSTTLMNRYNTLLTSSALATHDHMTQSQNNEGIPSSEDVRNSSNRSLASRRNSSLLTYSFASGSSSTDPSTPSPHIAESEEFDDEMEPTILDLPPSAIPAPSLLLNYSAHNRGHQIGSHYPRHMQEMPTLLPFKRENSHSPVSFARIPSQTNVPAPVLFASPVLSTTNMKVQPANPKTHDNVKEQPSPKKVDCKIAAVPLRYSCGQCLFISHMIRPQEVSACNWGGRSSRSSSPSSFYDNAQSSGLTCEHFGCHGLFKHTESDPSSLQFSMSGQQSARRTHPSILLEDTNFFTFVDLTVQGPVDRLATASTADFDSATKDVLDPAEVPRGRSRTRVGSSVSRRKPSPPRGVASSGRSQDNETAIRGTFSPFSK